MKTAQEGAIEAEDAQGRRLPRGPTDGVPAGQGEVLSSLKPSAFNQVLKGLAPR